MELSVVIPVRNEVENIAPLLAEIDSALVDVCDYEIIYVDDGSDDNTWQELLALCEKNPRMHLRHHQQSCGQSAALLTGVQAARAPWVVTLDGDGQNDPADIPAMLEIAANYSPQDKLLIIGHRVNRRDSRWRRFSSRVANGVRSRILGDATVDTGCGLKLFPRQLYLSLPYFDHMHRFLPALVKSQGGISLSTAVHHRPRLSGQSKYGTLDRLWVGIIDIIGVMWLQRRSSIPVISDDGKSS